MGERKVLNKYYPPDFDPEKLPRAKGPKNGQCQVRMMLPMSVRCCVCGEFMYKGTKFNSKKETVRGEEYLGIRIYRFYMKCSRCKAEFTIKTDPKNSDYACECGVSRNFEPWRAREKEEEDAKKEREEEEKGDVMRALENRTADSKAEIDTLETLDEIRALNSRNAKLTVDEVMDLRNKQEQDQADEERKLDDQEMANVVFGAFVRKLVDDDKEEFDIPLVPTTEPEKPPIKQETKPGPTVPTGPLPPAVAAMMWEGEEGEDPVNSLLAKQRGEELITDSTEAKEPEVQEPAAKRVKIGTTSATVSSLLSILRTAQSKPVNYTAPTTPTFSVVSIPVKKALVQPVIKKALTPVAPVAPLASLLSAYGDDE